MTSVEIDMRDPITNLAPDGIKLVFTPTRRLAVVGVVPPKRVYLNGGLGGVDLLPTDDPQYGSEPWAYKVSEYWPGKDGVHRYVLVPDSVTALQYDELVEVGDSFSPANPDTLWWMRMEELEEDVLAGALQGPPGPAGPAGPTGSTGLSAYQLAVANGFVGTEAAWLASLEGPEGPAGPSGSSIQKWNGEAYADALGAAIYVGPNDPGAAAVGSLWIVVSGAGLGQAPVALVAADGETLSGGVQSNFAGNGMWTRRGHTRARDWTGPNPLGGTFAGFDDPTFIPIATWLTDFAGTSFYAKMNDLGINGMLPAAGSVVLDNLVANGKWAVVTGDVHASGSISSTADPAVIGVSNGEEPWSVETYEAIIADNAAWLAGLDGPGRLALYNFSDPILNGDIGLVYFPDDMVLAGDWTTCDTYWIAGAYTGSTIKHFLDYRLYQDGLEPTIDQAQRGSHYGSMLDSIRKNYVAPGGPFGVWIENGAPYTETASRYISPGELKWAVWSTLVHGARSINYFNHTFRTGETTGAGSNNLNNTYYGADGVAGTGIYAATKEVNLRALQIATVINSPFDGYFVYGDLNAGPIETPGFLTAVTSTNPRGKYAGVDASCKWEPNELKHYILATTRESGAAINIPVTYRMIDQGQTEAVPVFGGTPITIERGGAIPAGFCEFSTTFATAATYQCWRID